jgi:hypothetical protein
MTYSGTIFKINLKNIALSCALARSLSEEHHFMPQCNITWLNLSILCPGISLTAIYCFISSDCSSQASRKYTTRDD